MGRGKLVLKLIENEKSRMTTYQKRKRGLKKKAEEFATLCGVPTCMIIYGPKLMNRPIEVDVWPKEATKFMEVVNLYRDKGFSSRGIKAYNLIDFFNERKRKVDDKVNKLRKSNLESKFPSCWDDRLNGFSVDQLRVLLVTFDNNIEVARRRIMMIKGDHDNHNHHHQYQVSLDCSKSDMTGGNSYVSQSGFSPSNHSHQVLIQKNNELVEVFNKQPLSSVKPLDAMQLYHPPLQLLPTYDFNPNDHNQMTIGGDQLSQYAGGSGGNVAPYSQLLLQPTLYFDPTAVIVDNVMINNQRAMYFCGPSMQTLHHYEQCPPLPSNISSSQIHGSHHHHHHLQFNESYRDMNEFGVKNERGKK